MKLLSDFIIVKKRKIVKISLATCKNTDAFCISDGISKQKRSLSEASFD